jgi:hypothetical protein
VPAIVRTIVYIDALNLYYRALRDTPYRWLDPVALSDALLPADEVVEVKYFTAKIKAIPNDPGAPTRQQVYLRALDTVPRLTVVPGFFNRRRSFFALAMGRVGEDLTAREKLTAGLARLSFLRSGLLTMKSDPIPRVRIWKTEEKGSDVNLASHLLVDAFNGEFEQAAVISNDSDLGWPVRYVRETVGKPVVVLNPSMHRNRHLTPDGTPPNEDRRIGLAELAVGQLPLVITDGKGKLHRPPGWDQAKKH